MSIGRFARRAGLISDGEDRELLESDLDSVAGPRDGASPTPER